MPRVEVEAVLTALMAQVRLVREAEVAPRRAGVLEVHLGFPAVTQVPTEALAKGAQAVPIPAITLGPVEEEVAATMEEEEEEATVLAPVHWEAEVEAADPA